MDERQAKYELTLAMRSSSTKASQLRDHGSTRHPRDLHVRHDGRSIHPEVSGDLG